MATRINNETIIENLNLTPDQTLQEEEEINPEIELRFVLIPIIPIVSLMSTTPSAQLNCEAFVYGDSTTLGTRWEMWLKRFEMYLTATGLTDADKKKACFLYQIGPDAHAVFKTLKKVDNSDTYAEAHAKLTKHFITTRSQFSEDQIFRRSSKRGDESVDEFVMRLRQLATHCKYADVDKEILAHFVAHCNMEAFQMKAVREDTLDLAGALVLARGYERDAGSLLQLKTKQSASCSINYMNSRDNIVVKTRKDNKYSDNQNKCKYCGRNQHPNQQPCPALNQICSKCGKKNHFAVVCRSGTSNTASNHYNNQQQRNQNYRYQNQQHINNANNYNQQQSSQQQQLQFRTPNTNNYRRPQLQQNYRNNYNTQASVYTQHQQQQGTSNQAYNVGDAIEHNNSNGTQYPELDGMANPEYTGSAQQFAVFELPQQQMSAVPTVDIELGTNLIKMIIDTGAAINMLNIETYNNLMHKPQLQVCNNKFYAYGELQEIKILGQFTADMKYNGRTSTAAFLVAPQGQHNLLSYRTAVQLGVVQLINQISATNYREELIEKLKSKYPNVFSGKLGKLKNQTIKIEVDEKIKPTKQKLRKIPEKLKQLVEVELLEMEKQGIIERVSWPTDWISNIVPVPKSEIPLKIRITCDMRPLNKAIKRTRYATTTVNDVISEANGAKYMSKLDLEKAYHQAEIDPASRDVTTITTHIGLFRFTRLIMGISLASEIFSEIIRNIISECKGASYISDDILIWGRTQEEHDRNLHFVLNKLEENGLTLNIKKSIFNVTKVVFFRLEFSDARNKTNSR